MRFKLTLYIDKNAYGNMLPFNYQYELQAVIYRLLSQSNEAFATWLHNNGFCAEKKQFKLFTFSRLHIPKFKLHDDGLAILSDTVIWHVSFLPERSTLTFIEGLFSEQNFELGTRKMRIKCHVQSVEMLSEPDFKQTMSFQTLSPICIPWKKSDNTEEYIPLDHREATELIKQNLLSKYLAMEKKKYPIDNFPFEITLLSPSKPMLVAIKQGTPQQSRIKGFMCRFRLTAPPDLMKIMYESGCGSKNSLGFGMVNVWKDVKVKD